LPDSLAGDEQGARRRRSVEIQSEQAILPGRQLERRLKLDLLASARGDELGDRQPLRADGAVEKTLQVGLPNLPAGRIQQAKLHFSGERTERKRTRRVTEH